MNQRKYLHFTQFLSVLASVPIHVYRRVVSPLIGPCCRYHPTCSSYALEALEVHGPMKGSLMSIWRVARCNPWSAGGIDPVPPRVSGTPPRESLG